MYTLILCLFIACLFPYFAKIPVAMAMKDQPGGYDNNHPRAQQAALTGFGARAVAAHQNSFESLIIFSAAIITALATQHVSDTIQNLAIVYLVSRIVYHTFYLLNWATLRSTIWSVSLIASLSILWMCIP
jgi:uncharacterized MAPEG superfamily protein